MQSFDTLAEALQSAADRGHRKNFQVRGGCLVCIDTGKQFQAREVRILEHQRFEGDSSADDTSILYVVRCSDGSSGCVVDAYSAYADSGIAEFMKQVHESTKG